MTDLALDSSNDLDIATGDLRLVDGDDETLQRIRFRLLTFLGEWYLDQRKGTPYFGEILVKNPDLDAIRAILRDRIEGTDGVVRVVSLGTELDAVTRKLSVNFTAVNIYGESIEGTV